MKKFLPYALTLAAGLFSFTSAHASMEHPRDCMYTEGEEASFEDPVSGLHLTLPESFELLDRESDLDTEDAERWIIFSDDQGNDIALIIFQLEGPLTPADLLLQFLLREFHGPVDHNSHVLFGVPSVNMLAKAGHPMIKISYGAIQGRFEYFNADYFFTQGNYGFNVWISPSENSKSALVDLEKQIEKMLDTLHFIPLLVKVTL